MLTTLYRRGLLGVADSRLVSGFMKRQGFKLGVGRFVAGEQLSQALAVIRRLEQQGFCGILDLLGEYVDTEAGADAITAEILAALDTLEHQPLNKYMSVKPTQLGLGLGLQFALNNARRVARRAQEIGAQICLDMENVPFVDGTLELYKALRAEGYSNVSTVLQSYLYRSMDDLKALIASERAPELRIVKGAYNETAAVAYQRKADVDAKYREMVFYGLEHGAKINVATHDDAIISEVEAYVRRKGLGSQHYEFQLLYGVRVSLQKALVQRGHLVRIYVPYGQDWYGYFSRRLAERPGNLLFVLKGLFG